jgi:alpha-beta hydrolase superfamily lysophospholipase
MEQESGSFKGQGNFDLYYRGYLPPGKPRAVLLVVHGLAEHSGRYTNVVNYFVPRGYAIYGFDQRGHGRSEGLRGYVEKFSEYISDLKTFFDMVQKHSDEKLFIVGHSVGGTIAAAYSLQHQDELAGLILSGPTITPGSSLSPIKIMLARLLSLVMPKLGVDVIDATALSQDQAVVAAYINDPLVYHGKIRARLGAELIKAMKSLSGQMPALHLPVLILSGTGDRLSNPEGSRLLYERITSKDKTLKLYDGFYHEIFNEPGRGQVFGDIESWLNRVGLKEYPGRPTS